MIAEVLEREEQRKYKDHHDSHQDLERKTDLDEIHEGVLSCRHDKGVRRCGER